MKWASDTYAIRASAGMSSGSAYARSIASRARSIRRLTSSVALLTEPSHHGLARLSLEERVAEEATKNVGVGAKRGDPAGDPGRPGRPTRAWHRVRGGHRRRVAGPGEPAGPDAGLGDPPGGRAGRPDGRGGE